jgi:hypothetical protein
LLALAPPDELPLYEYRAWIAREAAEARSEFTIDAMTTTANVSGDHGVVKLEASGTMGSDGDRSTWQVGGTCPSLGHYLGFSFSDDTGSESSNGPGLCLAGDSGMTIPFGMFAMDPAPDGRAVGPVSIRVVRESGRWFVSPVGTVLDMLDSFVEHVDERTLYPLMGLGYRLPPDATLTLNQPLQLTEATRFGHVFQFDGQAGQEVVGRIEGDSNRNSYPSAELYTADGEHVAYITFEPNESGCCAYPEQLHGTESYRLVMMEPLPAGVTLTLFDTDHAPKDLLDNDGFTDYGTMEQCSVAPGGGVECTSSGSGSSAGATPTTMVARPGVTATTAP